MIQHISPKQYGEDGLGGSDDAVFDGENIMTAAAAALPADRGYRYTYTLAGLKESQTDPLGYTTNYEYDVYGNLVTETSSCELLNAIERNF